MNDHTIYLQKLSTLANALEQLNRIEHYLIGTTYVMPSPERWRAVSSAVDIIRASEMLIRANIAKQIGAKLI